ncbi:hypothetical protein Vadar_010777 [Vaccinium darrowii]|uniref:Uncharacterized protein n=1 Tax=Vaccinium darrowii TaxID=229202 RepID=A0ACB7ZIG3_9ERIC|nr:hypothetical protein Vadar_010777 [Vaccinium darrowii]
MTVDELMATLEIHEQRINKRLSSTGQEQALQAKMTFRRNAEEGGTSQRARGRRRGCDQPQGRGDVGPTRGERGQEGECSADVQCYACCKYGHYSYDCTEDDSNEEVNEQANIAEEVEVVLLQMDACIAT